MQLFHSSILIIASHSCRQKGLPSSLNRGRSWDSSRVESHSPTFHQINEGPSGAKDRESSNFLGFKLCMLCVSPLQPGIGRRGFSGTALT